MFKHILVPLDGSYLAEAAIPAALELASRFDSKVSLLRVTRTPYVASGLDGSAYAELIVTLRQQEYDEADEYLKMMQRNLRQQNYMVETYVREGEPVAELILDVAQEGGVDTIVMSTHGRGGVSRWVFGSVADRVLRHADIPVVLIRAKEDVMNWTQPEVAEAAQH
ncbi:MAG: universal stress protein [Ardenticatenaceae bacterium]|nr:universal stress protein [Ardenticatenaceae bacterium]